MFTQSAIAMVPKNDGSQLLEQYRVGWAGRLRVLVNASNDNLLVRIDASERRELDTLIDRVERYLNGMLSREDWLVFGDSTVPEGEQLPDPIAL